MTAAELLSRVSNYNEKRLRGLLALDCCREGDISETRIHGPHCGRRQQVFEDEAKKFAFRYKDMKRKESLIELRLL